MNKTRTQTKRGNVSVSVLAELRKADVCAPVIEHVLRANEKKSILTGVHGSLPGLLAAELFEKSGRQVVIITAGHESAEEIAGDVSLFLSDKQVSVIGEAWHGDRSQVKTIENTLAEHAEVLRHLIEQPKQVVITDIETFLEPMPASEEVTANVIHLETRAIHPQTDFVRRLAYGGLAQQDYVTTHGEFAVRGGIVDVFPPGFSHPLRIEFFGDEIDSIREFDAISQRSIRSLDTVSFITSLFLDAETSERNLMTSCFSSDALIVLHRIEEIERATEKAKLEGVFRDAIEPFQTLELPLLKPHGPALDFGSDAQPAFNGSVAMLRSVLDEFAERSFRVFLLADSEQQAARFTDILANGSDELPAPDLHTVHFVPLSRGFILPRAKLAIITEHQVFNRRPVRAEKKRTPKGLSLREMRQLHVGDYVVHTDKGIGKFAGFETISVAGGLQETAKILYAENDVLYVNLNYLNRLQKYTANEGYTPKLSKLGSGEWDRIRDKTKRRIKEIARNLITLYARRKMAKGFMFTQDTQWQKEMEASFMYEDTPDQYQATLDVKKDMCTPVPMDRLICGDVGYGKTEVAIRAAFKAVLDGKQVAVLVPTTILAQQHFNTFNDRLHRYSAQTDVLSRFKTGTAMKDTLRRLKAGRIDIIIGTHRLLSKDVEFKDLGLLIIDEEHRFGVAAKEKLREMREHIDTMSLTATPIPRTLNFSLLGARDLSVIETPPKNRLPIVTVILPMTKNVVAEGIQREIARGGQIYFVNDRISDLELLADKIRSYVPGVRLGIAHGQMNATELERVMMRFLEKKIDVLVTTKIVESGLDIPNANTIFIHRAERFGLAELYQLRGRVGRSNVQAYAYLLVNEQKKLSRDALKRLQAIEEFSELSSGFQLAMRDLEIRGAGNLLGAEQSGFITEIGFELYLATVEETVGELKQSEFQNVFGDAVPAAPKKRPDVVMELGIDAYLPQTFIPNATERFDIYKRLYTSESETEIREIEEELFDRFSLLPTEVENLLFVVRLRLLASTIRLSRVTLEAKQLTLALPPNSDEEFYVTFFPSLMDWVSAHPEKTKLEQDKKQVRLIIRDIENPLEVRTLLLDISELVKG